LSDYLPHNQILWVFVKMGAIGGTLFWLFFNSFVFRGAMILTRLKDSYLKAVCAVCVVAIVNQFVVSYVDMQLAWYRNMVYLGLLMGLVPVLERLDGLVSAKGSAVAQV
jgi:O-antigen ligase